jgi:hypothetical protein
MKYLSTLLALSACNIEINADKPEARDPASETPIARTDGPVNRDPPKPACEPGNCPKDTMLAYEAFMDLGLPTDSILSPSQPRIANQGHDIDDITAIDIHDCNPNTQVTMNVFLATGKGIEQVVAFTCPRYHSDFERPIELSAVIAFNGPNPFIQTTAWLTMRKFRWVDGVTSSVELCMYRNGITSDCRVITQKVETGN